MNLPPLKRIVFNHVPGTVPGTSGAFSNLILTAVLGSRYCKSSPFADEETVTLLRSA